MRQRNNKKVKINIGRNKKVIIFDLDGTLYSFKGSSIKESGLYKKILENTKKYIIKKLNKNEKEAKILLKEILKEYGENISIALEERFGVNRYNYFNEVWDISAKDYIDVKNNLQLRKKLLEVQNNFNLLLLSDAPKIWIEKVLKELKIDDIFKGKILSGESDTRKVFNNAFEKVIKNLRVKPENCIVFGDQKETDIIPAKKLGMKTVFVNQYKNCPLADYNIKNILELKKALENIVKRGNRQMPDLITTP